MPFASALLPLLAAAASAVLADARIVAEWDPGFSEAELGGALVVDGYGVDGLGAYEVRSSDGTAVLAVCIEADLGHSLDAAYTVDASVDLGAQLDYLAWAYLRPGVTPTDEQAAAVNALAWRYTAAQRRTGGPVWQGDALEVRVLGVGGMAAVEEAIAALHAEATARRGPWALTDPAVADGRATLRLSGPGGPISEAVVRFEGDGGWTADAVTDDTGSAGVVVPGEVGVRRAWADAPGQAVALVAPGSQRLAAAGPSVLVETSFPAPVTTTSTTTTTTTTAPPTTAAPTTTTSAAPPPPTTTVAPTTTTQPPTATTTTAPITTTTTTTTTSPPTATSTTAPAGGPPELPRTGSVTRRISRLAALVFAGGAFAVLAATPRRRVSRR